jgi:hypothetical protein
MPNPYTPIPPSLGSHVTELAMKTLTGCLRWLWKADLVLKFVVLALVIPGVSLVAGKFGPLRPHAGELTQLIGFGLVLFCALGAVVNGPHGRK